MKHKIYRDPVCGTKINRQKAKTTIKYNGYGYFVCCPLCQSEFQKNPKKYADPEYAYKLSVDKKERNGNVR